MPMNKEDARKLIRESAGRFLNRDNSGKGWECPFCHSGTHSSNGDGLKSKDGVHWTCFACDNVQHIDVIEIVGKRDGVSGYLEQLNHCADLMGITIDEGFNTSHRARSTSHKPHGTLNNEHNTMNITQCSQNSSKMGITEPTPTPQNDTADAEKKAADEKRAREEREALIIAASKEIEATDYHRGITLETLKRFNVGFCKEWRLPGKDYTPTPRLIIPTGQGSYLARDTRPDIPEWQKKYTKMKQGPMQIFNASALYNSGTPIFIVEGEIDALSIIDVGGAAVGLGSTEMVGKFLQMVKEKPPTQPLIIALDNDNAGTNGTTTLKKGLKALEIPFTQVDITGECKDANEALMKDREAFTARVTFRKALEAENVAHALDGFLQRVEESKNKARHPTGFKALDEALDGGLYAGLYIVGAVSSLGKTTLCLQIADQLAQHGDDVLLFSLEMARDELIAKTISRLTYHIGLEQRLDSKCYKTTRGVLSGNYFNDTERELVNAAVARFKEHGARLYITEGIGNVTTKVITEKVRRHKILTGRTPVVIVDYLQIITPNPDASYATDKQNTDRAVLELKRLSRDYSTPVIGISSFNRDNYFNPVSMVSFKESGAIEYSSDVLLALQLDGMDHDSERGDGKQGKRDESVRKIIKNAEKAGREGKAQIIQVKILKNRNGSRGSVRLDYTPKFNYFIDHPEPIEKEAIASSEDDDADPF